MPAFTPQLRLLLTSLTVWCGLLSATGCDSDESPPTEPLAPNDVQSEPKHPPNKVSLPAARPPHPDDWFEDVTERSGVSFAYRNGREGGHLTVVESVGGGVAMLDFDRDGDLDLFFPGGGHIDGEEPTFTGRPHAFFRNDGDWTFTDITSDAGLSEPGDYSLGCSVGDFNRDGFPDLFVSCYGRSRLFQNTGQQSFADVTESAGLQIDGFSTASVWADFDHDGWPDLYVVGYLETQSGFDGFCGDSVRNIRDVCGPWNYPAARDRLFRNLGNGRIEEVTDIADLRTDGKGLGVVAADVNADGWLDLYVANDATENHLYLGQGEFRFNEMALLQGVAVDQQGTPQGSMGVDLGDVDGDGRGDLFVTNYEMEDNSLYRSLGESGFAHASRQFQLAETGRPYVGFGTGYVDLNSDGWLDLYVVNGHVQYHTGQMPFTQLAVVLQNQSGRGFADVSATAGPWFSIPHAGRGAAAGDLDNDGAADLVIVEQNAPVTVLRNRLSPENWFAVKLRGTESEPLAVGAVVTARFSGRQLVRHVTGGAGYLSHKDRRLIFPVDPTDSTHTVTVRWPGGTTEVFRGLISRQTSELLEGEGSRE